MDYHKNVMKVALSGSLRELMTRNMFEKITIKKICDETGVIRATFYNYFDDKYDCLNWIVYHDMVDGTKNYVEKGDFSGIITVILKTVDENRAFYKVAYQVTGQNDFEDMVRGNAQILLKEYLRKFRKKNVLVKYDDDALASYFAAAVAFHIRAFAQDTKKRSVEDMKQIAMDLLNHSFADFVE